MRTGTDHWLRSLEIVERDAQVILKESVRESFRYRMLREAARQARQYLDPVRYDEFRRAMTSHPYFKSH